MLGLLLCLCGAATMASAFPPAPCYSIYGIVRDQVGQKITSDNAELVLLKDGAEVGRTPIHGGRQLDQNYELQIRIDQSRAGTVFYSDKALAPQGLYSLLVEMDGAIFHPIEVAGVLRAGKGGERVRLDLNLGEDKDRDGLPDAWEAWQLHQAGRYPDEQGNWDLQAIDPTGDFDKDGQTNRFEYIAGTFAGDATETFSMSIKERQGQQVRLEFFGITGKTYTIEASPDARTWKPIAFTVGSAGSLVEAHTASDVGLVQVLAVPLSPTKEFYRLSVR